MATNLTLPCDGGLVNLRVGAIIQKNGKFLMAGNDRDAYLYSVGGRIRFGETAGEAVVREVREETGLEVRLDAFLGIFHNHNMVWSNGDAAHVISAMYTASIVSGEPRIDEESYELRFFGKEEIPDLFAEDHIACLDAYFKGIRYPLLRENKLPD